MNKKMPKGKPFEKGKSGNPAGRPKALPDLREVIQEALAFKRIYKGVERTTLEAIIGRMSEEAVKGDLRCAQFLIERFFGKLKEDNENDWSKITVLHVYDDKAKASDNPEIENEIEQD